jgi:hypothetical protein
VPESFCLAGICLQDFDIVWSHGLGKAGILKKRPRYMMRNGMGRSMSSQINRSSATQTNTPIVGQVCMVKKQIRDGRATFRALEDHVGLGYALESR